MEWKTLDFKQKTIFTCGVILIVFGFVPWWVHPIYQAFWIPLIGIYIGQPFNNFIFLNIVYYILAVITVAGGFLCCYEQKNHKIALYGAIIATISSFIFMTIFIANTCDLNIFNFAIDALITDAMGKSDEGLTFFYLSMKVLIEQYMYLEMFSGYIISLSYATQYYIGSLPILFGALAAVVAW